MADKLGDAPISEEYRAKMKALAKVIDELFNPKPGPKQTGFVLMVFSFEDAEGRTNYISNADRKDVVATMKHQIARFEGQPDVTGRA